jgi:hypothetical protein
VVFDVGCLPSVPLLELVGRKECLEFVGSALLGELNLLLGMLLKEALDRGPYHVEKERHVHNEDARRSAPVLTLQCLHETFQTLQHK